MAGKLVGERARRLGTLLCLAAESSLAFLQHSWHSARYLLRLGFDTGKRLHDRRLDPHQLVLELENLGRIPLPCWDSEHDLPGVVE